MTRRTESYAIRIGVEGGKAVRTEFGQVGADGEKSFKRIDAAGKGAGKTLHNTAKIITTTVAPAFAALGASLSARQIVAYSDKFKQLEGRLKIVSDSMDDVKVAQDGLFEIAQETRQPLEDLTDLYTRLNMALGENKRAQYDVLGISETFAKALAVTGEGSAQAQSAILQFSQAIQSDFKNSAQEINALVDSAPRLAIALQQSFGDGTKSLKKLGKEGVLSTESVLRALEPLASQAQEISSEFDNMSQTVGQAITQLDNAFLQLIGQSQLVEQGTSSVATGISTLADNLDTIAGASEFVAAVFAGKLATSLYTTATAYTANTAQAVAYQLALARMAGVSATAAAGQIGLANASRALGSVMALLGGPVGVALIGTMILMKDATNGAKDAQETLNTQMSTFRQVAAQYQTASSETRQRIEEDTAARIEAYKQELQAIEAIASRLEGENFIFKKAREIGSMIGIDTSTEDVRGVADNVRAAIGELEDVQARFNETRNATQPGITPPGITPPSGAPSGTSSAGGSSQNPYQDILTGLERESAEIEKQITLFGRKDSAMNRALSLMEIENTLREEGIILSSEQEAQIEDYLSKIEDQKTQLESLEQAQESAARSHRNSMERMRMGTEETYNAINGIVDSAINGQITSWRDLGSVVLNELQNILAAQIRVSNSGGSSGGGLSSLVGSISGLISAGSFVNATGTAAFSSRSFGSLTSAAALGAYGPGFANGGIAYSPSIFGEAGPEAAVPLPDGRSIPVTLNNNSAKGGDTYYIDARGADSAAIARLEATIKAIGGSVKKQALTAVQSEFKRNPNYLK